jgi:hypothetical protein
MQLLVSERRACALSTGPNLAELTLDGLGEPAPD